MSVGPALGSLLYDFGGFSLPFLCIGASTGVVAILSIIFIPSLEDANKDLAVTGNAALKTTGTDEETQKNLAATGNAALKTTVTDEETQKDLAAIRNAALKTTVTDEETQKEKTFEVRFSTLL